MMKYCAQNKSHDLLEKKLEKTVWLINFLFQSMWNGAGHYWRVSFSHWMTLNFKGMSVVQYKMIV